jgi:hypothetical protein
MAGYRRREGEFPPRIGRIENRTSEHRADDVTVGFGWHCHDSAKAFRNIL